MYSYFTFPFFQIDSSILKHLSDVTKKRCFWCLLLCILKLIKSWHSIFSFKQLSLTLLLREPEGYKRMFWGLNRFFLKGKGCQAGSQKSQLIRDGRCVLIGFIWMTFLPHRLKSFKCIRIKVAYYIILKERSIKENNMNLLKVNE